MQGRRAHSHDLHSARVGLATRVSLPPNLLVAMLRYAAFVLPLVIAPAASAAQGADEPSAVPPRTVAMPASVEVPLLESGIPGATLPVISVMINGRGPYRFGVETGAGFVAVSRELVTAIGLKKV